MGFVNCLAFLVVVVGATVAYTGDFVPKSFYVLDEEGHKSDVVYIRNRRDLERLPILHRIRRGGGGTASSYSSASAGSGSGGFGGGYSGGLGGGAGFGPDDIHHSIQSGLNAIAANIANAANAAGAAPGGGGASSYSTSYSSAGSGSYGGPGGSGGVGYSAPSGSGYSGAPGPQLVSRFGEEQGSGIHVSGSASGPHGAFSSSSSSSDGTGKVKYSVQSGKY